MSYTVIFMEGKGVSRLGQFNDKGGCRRAWRTCSHGAAIVGPDGSVLEFRSGTTQPSERALKAYRRAHRSVDPAEWKPAQIRGVHVAGRPNICAKEGSFVSGNAQGSSSKRLTVAARRGLGAWYTPSPLTEFAAAWAIERNDETVLDPGCGDAAFLVSAARRLKALGTPAERLALHLKGIDLNADAIATAAQALAAEGVLEPDLTCADFFTVAASECFDALIGNPPYVRYQLFRDANRTQAIAAAARAGVILPQLTSAWAPYLVHATAFLRTGGRLAMVLPGELLHAGYAAAVREFLLRQFRNLTLVTFEEQVFPGAMEEVILVLGTKGAQTADRALRVLRLDALEDLAEGPEVVLRNARPRVLETGQRWLTTLLEEDAIQRARAAIDAAGYRPLSAYGRVDLGVVTGANDFFVLTAEAVAEHSLPDTALVRTVSRANHVQGTRFTSADWQAQAAAGHPAHMLVVNALQLTGAVARYVDGGAAAGLPKRYKCRKRDPWYRVPYVQRPHLFLTYMSNVAPRLVVNDAGVTSTNTIHGVYLSDPLLAEPLAAAFLNSATLLSAEIEGRSYGGGVLKLEPREAMRVLLPRLTPKTDRALREALPRIDALVRARKLDEATAIVDGIVLDEKLKRPEIEAIRAALASLRARRLTRGRRPAR